MSAEKDWLVMLEKATSYAELQAAFAGMSADASAMSDSDAMVECIDEAIRRIEQERIRDQAELDGAASDYEAFKQEQAGVIGWFKRKLPFTETRKQELGHRETLNDQAAEILADNFVIARAQMLKERIASPQLRRMGHRATHWRDQFQNNESVNRIGDYGKVVSQLGKELAAAKMFVEAVRTEIEAFSSARFSDKEDQRRSTEDCKAAQAELKALADESQEKSNLRASALTTLKGLLISELSERDVEFKDTNQRLAILKELQSKQPPLEKRIDERLKDMKALVAKTVERDAIPEQREKLENTLQKLQREWEEAERSRLQAANEFDGPSQLYHAALAESQQAKAALNASQPIYDAYLAERNKSSQSAAEVTSDADFEASSSSVVAEYRRLEVAASVAAQKLSQRTAPYEHAKRTHDASASHAKQIRDKLDSQTAELKKLTNRESELQQQLLKAKQSLESSLPELRIAAGSYLDIARQITWIDSCSATVRALQSILDDHTTSNRMTLPPSPGRFSTPFSTHTSMARELAELQENAEHLERAVQQLASYRQTTLHEITTLAKHRREALLHRGQMLLDQSVLSELDLNDDAA